MTKALAFFALLFVNVALIHSQQNNSNKQDYTFNNNFDLAVSSNIHQSSGALSWVHFHPITKNKKFKIGYGLRFTSQVGKDLTYETAPVLLTSKESGPQILFTKIYYENVDTLFITTAQNNALNITINLQYTIKEKYDIGFNIDALGFSFGKTVHGKYQSFRDGQNSIHQTAKPTPYNLLLVSDNDIGSLNSELYLRYWFKQKLAFKIGASFLFTEYTTQKKLRLNNDRWRNKALMAMIGITFSPFK